MYIAPFYIPTERIDRQPTPQQYLLDLAERMWGPQFDGDGIQAWWCTSDIPGLDLGAYSAITNGEQHFIATDSGYSEVKITDGNQIELTKPKPYDLPKAQRRIIPLSWLT